MEQNSGERLKQLIARFVLKYNYWGYLFSRIRRKPAKNFGSIMGVKPEADGTVTLLYEPDLFMQTDDKEIYKIIEHEGMHLLNKHITRLLRILANETIDERKQTKIEAWNIAADCSVNVQANIREPIIIAGKGWPPQLPKTYDMEEGKVTEEYYLTLLNTHKENMNQMMQQICKNCPKNNQSGDSSSECKGDGKGEKEGQGEGKGTSDQSEGKEKPDQSEGGSCPGLGNKGCSACGGLDTHKNWINGTKGVPDLSALSRKIDQHISNIVKESVKSFNKDRGTIPSHISELIQSALAPPKAPYYQIIRKLVRGTRFSKFRRSPTKINRKRTYTFLLKDNRHVPQISPFPGKTRDMTFDICVLIDTSGSMSSDDILEGLSGVKNIIEKDRHCYTTVLEVDAAVEKEYAVKKLRDIQFDIKGRGGTTLYPGLKRARELNCDVCLAFTDGYTEDINSIPRKLLPNKLIWVITPNGTANAVNKTGFVVRI